MKRQATDWEKLFTNRIFHKGVVSGIHKELSNLNHKETRNLITKQKLSSKESAYQRKKCRFDRWVGKTPGGGNGNPFQYSCLGSPMDRGTWQATVHLVTKELDTTERLNNNNKKHEETFHQREHTEAK